MIQLRLLSILGGFLVLLAPTLLLWQGGGKPLSLDGTSVIGAMFALVVVAASFFYIGVYAREMRRSARLRVLGGVLLVAPFAASIAVLWRSSDDLELWASGLLFCFTAVLFLAFVFPASQSRKHRPMRSRESLAN
jgi:hypothetical protein